MAATAVMGANIFILHEPPLTAIARLCPINALLLGYETTIRMIHQSPAQIYKAQQRGHFENAAQRWQATFNFGHYTAAGREPFSILKTVNDETLGPQQEIIRTEVNATLLLIPLVGAIAYAVNGEVQHAEPNEAVWLPLNGDITLTNPYESDLVNFLYIVFSNSFITEATTVSINLAERNVLSPFSLPGTLKAKMGLFDGRGEALYKLADKDNGLFLYIISGAFEVQGRLLEERDALALWNLGEADMEALSENAVILLLEIPR